MTPAAAEGSALAGRAVTFVLTESREELAQRDVRLEGVFNLFFGRT